MGTLVARLDEHDGGFRLICACEPAALGDPRRLEDQNAPTARTYAKGQVASLQQFV